MFTLRQAELPRAEPAPERPSTGQILSENKLLIGGLTAFGAAAGALAGSKLSPILALLGGVAAGTTAYAGAFALASR